MSAVKDSDCPNVDSAEIFGYFEVLWKLKVDGPPSVY